MSSMYGREGGGVGVCALVWRERGGEREDGALGVVLRAGAGVRHRVGSKL